MAEDVGFEPTIPCGITVFKTAAFNHSANPPRPRYSTTQRCVLTSNLDAFGRMWVMTDKDYMLMAIEEAKKSAARGEVPIGAVVVQRNTNSSDNNKLINTTETERVIATSGNAREELGDPTAHAEIIALRKAAARLGRWRLSDCCVYVTLEPCVMCAGAMHQARIERCVYGAPDTKAGALGTLYAINEDTRINHNFEVKPGVLQDECADLLRDFFKGRR